MGNDQEVTLLSSMDDYSDDGSEEKLLSREESSEKMDHYRNRIITWQILCLVCVAATFLSSTLCFLQYMESRPLTKPAALVPHFGRKAVKFEKHEMFGEPPSEASNRAWGDMVPKGRGYIYVENPKNYFGDHRGIPNTRNDGSENYVLSVFHQLHCLDLIRIGYHKLDQQVKSKSGRASNQTQSPLEIPHHVHAHLNGPHLQHCIDYLRQALMCHADTTLEWPPMDKKGRVAAGTQGWGVTHQCGNFDAVKKWAEKRRGNEKSDII